LNGVGWPFPSFFLTLVRAVGANILAGRSGSSWKAN
jgi:hypothetical protein